jgi:hypothetical protein
MATKQVEGVAHTMPAGYAVQFHEKLGRKKHVYTLDGEIISGVTNVSKTADDGSKFSRGAWWGMLVGAVGTQQLIEKEFEYDDRRFRSLLEMDKDALKAELTTAKLTTNHTRDAAGDVGSEIHRAISGFLETGIAQEVSKEAEPKFNGWMKFYEEHGIEAIHTERVIASHKHKVAGTLDFYGLVDGHAAICDWKSGTYLPLEQSLQLAAYEGIGREAGFVIHDEVKKYVVKLEPEDYVLHECTRPFEDFLTLLATYEMVNR